MEHWGNSQLSTLKQNNIAGVNCRAEGDTSIVELSGRLDVNSTGQIWRNCVSMLGTNPAAHLKVDAHQVDYCDGAGAVLLLKLSHLQKRAGGTFAIEGLKPEFEKLIEMLDTGPEDTQIRDDRRSVGIVEEMGHGSVRMAHDMGTMVGFIGELAMSIAQFVTHPLTLRWRDTFLLCEKAGANAVGITSMMGMLIGLILAFQSAISMKQFGAEVYVADLVSISMFRELGPLITAFILASRSGSAFAAEIGTMKINEEIDALMTMGLNPMQFLILPRVIAATLMLPLLTMFNNAFGVLGAGVVMVSMGFAPVTYFDRVQAAVSLTDIFGGLAKTFVFGILIAGIGCLRGMQTGSGASAVGDSATKAVVSGIVAIVITDGVFAVLYYFLNI